MAAKTFCRLQRCGKMHVSWHELWLARVHVSRGSSGAWQEYTCHMARCYAAHKVEDIPRLEQVRRPQPSVRWRVVEAAQMCR